MPRVPAGVPSGGQFAASVKGSADITAPPSLDERLSVPGARAVLAEADMPGFHDFTEIEVRRTDDGTFDVTPAAYTDVRYGLALALAAEQGVDYDSLDDADRAVDVEMEVTDWLDRHSEDAIAWIEDNADVTVDRAYEWDHQRIMWGPVNVDADAGLDDLVDAADEVALTHPDHTDEFYTRMLDQAGGWRARRDVVDQNWTVPSAPVAVADPVAAIPAPAPVRSRRPTKAPTRRRGKATRKRGTAVGGDSRRLSRECRECFGFPYHADGCAKTE